MQQGVSAGGHRSASESSASIGTSLPGSYWLCRQHGRELQPYTEMQAGCLSMLHNCSHNCAQGLSAQGSQLVTLDSSPATRSAGQKHGRSKQQAYTHEFMGPRARQKSAGPDLHAAGPRSGRGEHSHYYLPHTQACHRQNQVACPH